MGLLTTTMWVFTALIGAGGAPIEMDVAGLMLDQQGRHVVLLRTAEEPARYLNIPVSPDTATALQMLLEGGATQEPSTVQLLEQVVAYSELDVDAVVLGWSGGRLEGEVTLRRGEGSLRLMARAGDAITIAIGHRAPIQVSARALRNAAVDLDGNLRSTTGLADTL